MIEIVLPIHMSCAVLSLVLFIWRGSMMWIGRPLEKKIWRRTLPDGVDTLLLASGITMAVLIGASPMADSWLAAKLIALLVYIGLGMVAFRFGHTRLVKRGSFLAALVVFGYIVSVARTMQPWPWG